MFSGINSTLNVAIENDCGIPEWKKILIRKRKKGNGSCLTDDLSQQNPSSCASYMKCRKDCANSSANSLTKIVEQEFNEPSIQKKVTIGNINVQLRSVKCVSDEFYQQKNLINSNEDGKDTIFDNECKDLQYGPGIVDRLRTKFLKMGNKQTCPPVVRRFSSLENLPGNNSENYKNNAHGSRQNCFKFNTGTQYSSNVKKTQSLETLLYTPEHSIFIPGQRTSSRIKGKILNAGHTLVDINNESENKSSVFMSTQNRNYNLSTCLPNINTDELPKPDTVKEVKKIFESTTQKGFEKPSSKLCFQATSSTIIKPTSSSAIFESKRISSKKGNCGGINTSASEFTIPLEEETPPLAGQMNVKLKDQESFTVCLSDNRSLDQSTSSHSPSLQLSFDALELGKGSIIEDSSSNLNCNLSLPENNTVTPQSPDVYKGSEMEKDEQLQEVGKKDEEIVLESVMASKKSWLGSPHNTTSVIYDFRGKNVKPNISLNPTPFGCQLAEVTPNSDLKKRLWSPSSFDIKGVSSIIDDYFQNVEEEDWDEMDIGADLPVISGVVFHGENIKVGRGAILERRNKQLNIQFNDEATSTFEYPAENESPSSEEIESLNFCSLDYKKVINSASNLRSKFSNYTPQVLESNDFKLGISQTKNHQPHFLSESQVANDVTDLEAKISVNLDDTGGWSTTETVDILF